MKVTRLLIAPVMFVLCLPLIQAQDIILDENDVMREMVLDQNIRTIELYRGNWKNSYPILNMDEDMNLTLEFDELSGSISDFYYRIFHCNADWRRSDLLENEYLEGYMENRIDEVEASFNTYATYMHYWLRLPNEDLRLTRSGNYILLVYRDNNPEEAVFSKRFMITEGKVRIEGNAHRPILSKYRDTGQEVDVSVQLDGFRIDNPHVETSLSIYQNGIWDYSITGLKPLFVNPGDLSYDYQEENVFLAGNEYRMFNTRNTRVREARVQQINFLDYFHYELKPDEVNPAHLYFDRDDLNGHFYIEAVNTSDPAVEADYVFVHFRLIKALGYYNGDVYITGASTNYQFTEMNKMHFDAEAGEYRASLFLKQGNHNYRYIFLPNDGSSFDIAEIEGSHYETKNEYLVLFYYRGPSDMADRLVGHEVLHANGM